MSLAVRSIRALTDADGFALVERHDNTHVAYSCFFNRLPGPCIDHWFLARACAASKELVQERF